MIPLPMWYHCHLVSMEELFSKMSSKTFQMSFSFFVQAAWLKLGSGIVRLSDFSLTSPTKETMILLTSPENRNKSSSFLNIFESGLDRRSFECLITESGWLQQVTYSERVGFIVEWGSVLMSLWLRSRAQVYLCVLHVPGCCGDMYSIC